VWEEYEKKMINQLLSDYLKKNKYKKIVLHLPEEIIDFILPNFKDAIVTTKGQTTSIESLENLHAKLKKIVEDYEYVERKYKIFEEMRSIALFQFGKDIGSKLLKNTTIKGRYPNRKIFESNEQIGMLTEGRGLISLTLKGAEKISERTKYNVEIYDGFKLIGSVFAPGIKNADSSIRIGDEVIVKRKKKLVAVGVSQMNGEEMVESSHGEAIKIRHRI
jgi:archaeosine synthase